MPNIHCIVVTPETTLVDAQASFVVLPLEDGEKGIGPNHSPLIARVGAGELRLKSADGGSVDRYFVDGGFVQIADNQVSVMTGRAVPVNAIDARVTEERLETARKRTPSDDESFAQHARLLRQLRAQLRLARRGG